jgi:hypothetical protein
MLNKYPDELKLKVGPGDEEDDDTKKPDAAEEVEE